MRIDHKLLKIPAEAAAIDYPGLMAGILASQALSCSATAQIHHDVGRSVADAPQQAIATLIQARPGWRAAAGALGGSFHPGVAALVSANGL